ncbi:hypothetical protein M426DRAFT_265345 [Hypoxylon sp. CI-4A]|nr:hypothetical protein M426DRAFT_265345 [Hypoxylon sp. CI-4A]
MACTVSVKPTATTMEFYDIAMRRPASVNPWKSRLALNFKAVPYKTIRVPLPDIPAVRRGLGVPACRQLADGEDFYTLPVLVDHNTNAKLGDSFDIAVYLQKTYPNSGAGDLFPDQVLEFTYDKELPAWAPPLSVRHDVEHQEYSRFNTHVDAAFSVHVGLAGSHLPIDDQRSRNEFVRRAHVSCWEDFDMKDEARMQMKESLRATMRDIAKVFEKDTSGPFVLGQRASYADLIVGGWLHFFQATLPDAEFREIRSWHEGIFGRLYDALEKYAEIKL